MMTTRAPLIQRLQQFAQTQPDRTALSDTQGSQISYRQLWQRASRIAGILDQYRDKNDFAFVLANKGILQAVAIISGLISQRPVAIIDLRQGSARVAEMLQQGRNLVGLIDGNGRKLLDQLTDSHTPLPTIHCHSIDSENSSDDIQTIAGTFNHPVTTATTIVPPQTALIIYTSGSTGMPKGVCIGSQDLDARLTTEQQWFEISSRERILGVLPVNFDVGLTQLLGTLFAGAEYVFCYSWFPADIIKQITLTNPSGLAMSPMIWKGLLRFKDQELLWQTLNQLRYATLSGGTIDLTDQQKIIRHLRQATLIKTYGQTEMFRIAAHKVAPDTDALMSVGQAYPGVSFVILDDAGQPLPAGKTGVVAAKGMGKMIGYVGNPQNDDATSMILTGDLGHVDEQGRLTISGRKNDMVKIMDQRVFPQDVAHSIKTILNLPDVVVVATDDTEPKLLAVFECGPDHHLSKQDMLKTLRQQLASHLIPKHLYQIDKIPATLNGKVNMMAIKAFIQEQEQHA
ncbi:class I adenylate-forming enzyme family protein [Gynuella sunshinyii]|uniref:Acyl-CoA synthetase (AMP-forming)/AMP-acid ligase II n=1 Tax=Gynuella sunshinyii YC6258 TaxID=1445510 RepID=A0A0C5VGW8_9GAMM|nr:class I adenylate-forming enzyme family protein [Gynuella sunshinyii]AJQ93847.1 acyl-CoA synthetase (AMP-forming)/AMP-acid ligase II [Gynuella sunshinyii YC6258]